MMRSPFVNAPRADSRSCGLSFAVGHDMRDAVASTGLDTVVGGGSLRQAFVAAMAPQGLTRRPSDPESMRSLAAEVSGLGARARRRAGLRPWLLAHPVDLVIAEVDPGAALAATAAQVPCVLHSFGRRPGPGALVRALLTGPVGDGVTSSRRWCRRATSRPCWTRSRARWATAEPYSRIRHTTSSATRPRRKATKPVRTATLRADIERRVDMHITY